MRVNDLSPTRLAEAGLEPPATVVKGVLEKEINATRWCDGHTRAASAVSEAGEPAKRLGRAKASAASAVRRMLRGANPAKGNAEDRLRLV